MQAAPPVPLDTRDRIYTTRIEIINFERGAFAATTYSKRCGDLRLATEYIFAMILGHYARMTDDAKARHAKSVTRIKDAQKDLLDHPVPIPPPIRTEYRRLPRGELVYALFDPLADEDPNRPEDLVAEEDLQYIREKRMTENRERMFYYALGDVEKKWALGHEVLAEMGLWTITTEFSPSPRPSPEKTEAKLAEMQAAYDSRTSKAKSEDDDE